MYAASRSHTVAYARCSCSLSWRQIFVSGNYMRSCFGCYLDQLVRHPLPIRVGQPVMEDDKVLSIPKELWRLVDYISTRGMEKVDLFLQSGDQSEIDHIVECLDTGKSLDDFSTLLARQRDRRRLAALTLTRRNVERQLAASSRWPRRSFASSRAWPSP